MQNQRCTVALEGGNAPTREIGLIHVKRVFVELRIGAIGVDLQSEIGVVTHHAAKVQRELIHLQSTTHPVQRGEGRVHGKHRRPYFGNLSVFLRSIEGNGPAGSVGRRGEPGLVEGLNRHGFEGGKRKGSRTHSGETDLLNRETGTLPPAFSGSFHRFTTNGLRGIDGPLIGDGNARDGFVGRVKRICR